MQTVYVVVQQKHYGFYTRLIRIIGIFDSELKADFVADESAEYEVQEFALNVVES